VVYDVVIVGGGPAGAAAGTVLARRGLSVAILEKDTFPREKPCGGLLSGRGAREIDAVFGEGTAASVARASSTGCRLFYQGRLIADVDRCHLTQCVRRWELDAALIAVARDAGCHVLEGARVTRVDARTLEATTSAGHAARGRLLIAADGANSVVARAVRPGASRRRRRSGFGLAIEAPLHELATEELREACARVPHIYFGLAPWSYAWIFPCGDRVSLGFGGLRKRGVDFLRCTREFVAATCRPGAWERLRVRGHLLPLTACERRPGRGHTLLAGDAAGLVEPVTGEGIGFAVASGRLAAAAAADALAHGAPAEAARAYTRAYRREILPHFRQAQWARWLFFPKPCLHGAMRALERNGDRVRWYFDLLAGTLTYREYFGRLLRSRGSGRRRREEGAE